MEVKQHYFDLKFFYRQLFQNKMHLFIRNRVLKKEEEMNDLNRLAILFHCPFASFMS